MAREGCVGWLVVHDDGEVAFCTEAHSGRPCPGLGVHHAGGAMSCRLTVGEACPVCTAAMAQAS